MPLQGDKCPLKGPNSASQSGKGLPLGITALIEISALPVPDRLCAPHEQSTDTHDTPLQDMLTEPFTAVCAVACFQCQW